MNPAIATAARPPTLHPDARAAVALIQSGQRVFVHGAAATPNTLLAALAERSGELRDVELMHLQTLGPALYARAAQRAAFRVTNFFVGANVRRDFDFEGVDYLPCFLSEIPALIRSGLKRPDVALISLSPPDRHGYCTLGTSLDATRAAVDEARLVIAQINRRMPRVHGAGFVHISRLAAAIEVDEALPESPASSIGPVERSIGERVAGLIEDGACLQAGIGAIPDAVLAQLKNHRHLGVHTEMWSDHMLDLIECGAVDNSQKRHHPGRSVSTFLIGSKRVFDAVDDNPSFIQLPSDVVNDAAIIKQQPRMTAINSAVEVDLTGQVCADSIGERIISGVGGQMDFIRGASLAERGRPIIALQSRTARGEPKIVPVLRSGAGVVTTRSHVHMVVTEHGVADLYGKTLNERARALIAIAHPDDRAGLDRAWHERRARCH